MPCSSLGNDKVSHLDRNNGNAPIGNLLLYGIAKFLIELMAAHNHILQRGAANGIAQRRLRRKGNRKIAILYFGARLFGIPNHPKQHCIDVKGNKVAR